MDDKKFSLKDPLRVSHTHFFMDAQQASWHISRKNNSKDANIDSEIDLHLSRER